ncbi:flagellin [Pelagibius litoralis]|uniref:Flagellin n=1 Tax=Pelagibius litoralis TaxID=374515 RepID=A0A967EXY7_9PROT|nr:flagellin [Pelagibius litoralis]NIA69469.1 flagellin [Pelagibius litoralis]
MPVVATNTAANSALRYLNNNSAQASASVGKLASGSRIVKASDDAAGLAIGTRLMADVTALTQAGINASQGASVVQVADGGLGRIGDVLQRMKALAAQSLSGVPTDTERAFIDAEFQQLSAEITDIADTTRFNGQSLLGSASTAGVAIADYFVGTDVSDTITVNLNTLSGAAADFTATALGLVVTAGAFGVGTAASAGNVMTLIDTAINTISEARATSGALISRFEFRGQQIATSLENIDAAKSAIMDVDLAAEQSKLVSNQVLVQAAVSAVSQANQIPQSLLRVLQ